MHYKNGREAKVGDTVVGKDCNGKPIAGVLYNAYPGAETCNGNILPLSIADQYGRLVSLCDCIHFDDVSELQSDKK